MEQFTPKKKDGVMNELRDALMNGNVIRYDYIHNFVEVLPREAKDHLRTMGNINPSANKIIVPHYMVMDTIKNIAEEYVMQIIRCEYSGCCQYTTYGVYLD